MFALIGFFAILLVLLFITIAGLVVWYIPYPFGSKVGAIPAVIGMILIWCLFKYSGINISMGF